MAGQTLTTFHKFPELPIELRFHIWRLIIEQPRVVELMVMHCSGRGTSHLKTVNLPALLHACQESRAEIFKFYEHPEKNRVATPFWIDYDTDVVCLFGTYSKILSFYGVYLGTWGVRHGSGLSKRQMSKRTALLGVENIREASIEAFEKIKKAAILLAPGEGDGWVEFAKRLYFDLVRRGRGFSGRHWIDISHLGVPQRRRNFAPERGMKSLQSLTLLAAKPDPALPSSLNERKEKGPDFFSIANSYEMVSRVPNRNIALNIFGHGERWIFTEAEHDDWIQYRPVAHLKETHRGYRAYPTIRVEYVTATPAFQQELDLIHQAKLSTKIRTKYRDARDQIKVLGKKLHKAQENPGENPLEKLDSNLTELGRYSTLTVDTDGNPA